VGGCKAERLRIHSSVRSERGRKRRNLWKVSVKGDCDGVARDWPAEGKGGGTERGRSQLRDDDQLVKDMISSCPHRDVQPLLDRSLGFDTRLCEGSGGEGRAARRSEVNWRSSRRGDGGTIKGEVNVRSRDELSLLSYTLN